MTEVSDSLHLPQLPAVLRPRRIDRWDYCKSETIFEHSNKNFGTNLQVGQPTILAFNNWSADAMGSLRSQ